MNTGNETNPSILIVDDTLENLKLLSEILAANGYQVRPATSGRLALRTIEQKVPDLVLLDVRMPDMDGYEVCRKLKAADDTCRIPVIFISASNEIDDKIEGFAVGGVDYITKPFDIVEVLARVRTHLKLQAAEDRLIAQNRRLAEEIEVRRKAEEKLLFLSTHDPLTGLPNRPMLLDRLHHTIHSVRRSSQQFWVCFVDLDHFKSINDNLGHEIGDHVLITAAHRMQQCLRASDTVVRLGGDEFVLLLIDMNTIEQVMATLRRVLTLLSEPIELQGRQISVSCSVGCASFPADGTSAEVLLHHADIAMYQAKKNGGNEIVLYRADWQLGNQANDRAAIHLLQEAAILTHAESGSILDINEAFEKTMGYRRQELLGQSYIQLGLWLDPNAWGAAFQEAEAKGVVRNFETQMLRQNGTLAYVSVSQHPVKVGKEPGYLIIIKDEADSGSKGTATGLCILPT